MIFTAHIFYLARHVLLLLSHVEDSCETIDAANVT